MRFGSSNPVLRRAMNQQVDVASYEAATYQGVAKKTFFYIALVLLGALIGISFLLSNNEAGMALIGFSGFLTFIFALVAFLSPRRSKVFGSLYCIGQGMLVGVVSLFFNAMSQGGAVMTALISTFVVFVVVATMYLTKLVVVNSRFNRFLLTFAIGFILSQFILYIVMIATGQNYFNNMGFVLMVSGLSIFLATLYLFFDMEMIRQVVEGGQPKEMEWYVSFGLVFTLLWLYVEILRLVVIFARRD